MFRKFPIGLQLSINYFFLYLAIFFQFFRSTPFAAAFFDNISRICTPLSSSEREEIVGFVFRLNKQINIRISPSSPSSPHCVANVLVNVNNIVAAKTRKVHGDCRVLVHLAFMAFPAQNSRQLNQQQEEK